MQQCSLLLCDSLTEDTTEAMSSSKKWRCFLGICHAQWKSTAFIHGCLQNPLDILQMQTFIRKQS